MSENQLSEAEANFLRRLALQLSAVEALGLPPLRCLLTIALDEGLSVTDIAQRIAAPQQSVSRYVSQLLGRYQLDAAQDTRPLIEQRINVAHPRKRALYLTEAGRDVICGLLEIPQQLASERA